MDNSAATATLIYRLLVAACVGTIGVSLYSGLRRDCLSAKHLVVTSYALQFCFNSVAVALGIGTTPGLELEDNAAYYCYSMLLILAGLVAYLVGYRLSAARGLMRTSRLSRRWSSRAVSKVFVGACLIASTSLAGFLVINGGLEGFLTDREFWRTEGIIGQGYLTFGFGAVLPLVGTAVVVSGLHRQGGGKSRFTRAILALGASVLPVSVLGFRGLVVYPVIRAVTAFHYLRRRLRARSVALFVIVLFFLGSWYGLDRKFSVEALRTATAPQWSRQLLLRSTGTDIVAVVLKNIDGSGGFQ